jgi:predicted RNase H-like HicB family nuclease
MGNKLMKHMKLTAVFVPEKEGGYTAFIEEVPGAITYGDTLEEAKENLIDAFELVLETNRDLAEKKLASESPVFTKETFCFEAA